MKRHLALAYGGLCYVLFLLVVLYAIGFVGDFLVPRTIDSGGATGAFWPSLGIDLALLGLFAVQHSGMARPAFKERWTRLVPREIERSTYVLATNLVFVLIFWFWRPLPATVWDVEAPWAGAVLWTLFGLGWAVVFGSTYLISHAHLFGLSQVFDHWSGRDLRHPGFRTPGLYRRVRHPIMFGFLVAFWATPTMTVGHLVFALATTGYIVVGVTLEEKDLVRFFGDRYRAYQEQVPMLVPRPGARVVAGRQNEAEDA